MRYFFINKKLVIYWEKIKDYNFDIFIDDRFLTNQTNTYYELVINDYEVHQIKIDYKKDNEVLKTITKKVKNRKVRKVIDISKPPYNAIGDGKTLNTKAIQKAIDDCKDNYQLYIPSGTFLVGGLFIHSNMEIYIAKGGMLLGSSKKIDYLPKIDSRFEGIERKCYRSLINIGNLNHLDGYKTKNIKIFGEGSIIGGGVDLLYDSIGISGSTNKEKQDRFQSIVDDGSLFNKASWRQRGRLLQIANANNVIIEGLTLGYSSSWNIHMIYSNNITTYNCKVISKGVCNGDGWNPDSSTNCYCINTTFDTGDDCIAIKSGKNPQGNKINRKTKNVYVFNCTSLGGHGLAIGSEVSGGISNIKMWDNDFSKTLRVVGKFV